MKIGILGGSFNPVHIGHLMIAEQVKDVMNLSKIIFVPSLIPPHKKISDDILAEHRYKMVELAVSNNQRFEVSDIEIDQKRKSYTIYTMKKFKEMYSSNDLFFIAGSDVLYDKWKDFDEILKLAKFIVVKRDKYPIKKNIDDRIKVIDNIISTNISSSKVRRICKLENSIRYLVPDKVERYIRNNSLYRNN